MPVTGRKAKPEDQRRNRVKSSIEWTDVPDVPYSGLVPSLPRTRTIMTKDGPDVIPLQKMTRDWWKAVTAMPHCVLWTDTDWAFARTTAIIADAAHCGVTSAASELRNREKVLGTTVDYRRDLRIRYVPVVDTSDAGPTQDTEVAQLDDYRSLYGDD